MIQVSTRGDWSKTTSFLERCLNVLKLGQLDSYGRLGVSVLENATPKDTGNTASSWYYQIVRTSNGVAIEWNNSNLKEGIPVVILLQYGHGLHQGGYVEGIDFINPALRPVFDQIAEDAWKELENG